jgi:2-dehydro-3-deoxygalactonokinase
MQGGRVELFHTAMTGEIFDLLRKHSLLGRLMPEREDVFDQSACNQGIERAGEPGGLLHHLFSVRTAGLLGTLEPRQLTSYLSGLLIAHEILDSRRGAEIRGQSVHLIGSSAVLGPYSWVMRNLGMSVELHDEKLAARGAHRLAQQAGLLCGSRGAMNS